MEAPGIELQDQFREGTAVVVITFTAVWVFSVSPFLNERVLKSFVFVVVHTFNPSPGEAEAGGFKETQHQEDENHVFH